MEANLGENFLEMLDENPLLPSMEIKLFAQYANEEGMSAIAETVRAFKPVRDVNFEKDVVNLIHENVRKISLVLLGFSVLMLLVAITLINNTVRLMVYSKRFLIRTMQLVGATRGFIRRPFVASAVIQGLVGGAVANAMLAVVVFFSARELPGIVGFNNAFSLWALFAVVFVAGIALTLVSTTLSVNKYLNLRTADLYV